MLGNILEFFSGIWKQIATVVLSITVADILDIIIIAFIIYKGIGLVRESRALQLLKGILLLLVVYILARWFGMVSLTYVLNNVFSYAIVAIAIVFQPEIRRALEHMGGSNFFKRQNNMESQLLDDILEEICKACQDMSNKKIGALIVFEVKTPLGEICDTGTFIDASVSQALVGNIFYPKSPLHDGAMVVRDGKINAAGCILPLTAREIGDNMGTRHRAAVGMTENSDAVVVVVSEETGNISVAVGGNIDRNFNGLTLRQRLEDLLIPSVSEEQATLWHRIVRRFTNSRNGGGKDA